MNDSKEQIDFIELKKNYPLTQFFERVLGVPPSLNTKTQLRYQASPCCGDGGNRSVRCSLRSTKGVWKWKCFVCGSGGDLIDAAAHYFGISPKQAVLELVNNPNQPQRLNQQKLVAKPKITEDSTRDQQALDETIERLLHAQRTPDPAVIKWFHGRGIPRSVVASAARRKVIITMPSDPNLALDHLLEHVGRDLLVRSGIWKEGSRAPAIIYRPLAFVTADRHGIEFRQFGENPQGLAKTLLYGEATPFIWKGAGSGYFIAEGGTDMLSAITLGTTRTVYALPGASSWKAHVEKWIRSLKGKDVLTGFDNDEAGRNGSSDMAMWLDSVEATHRKLDLPDKTDLNNLLTRLIEEGKLGRDLALLAE